MTTPPDFATFYAEFQSKIERYLRRLAVEPERPSTFAWDCELTRASTKRNSGEPAHPQAVDYKNWNPDGE